MIINTGDNIRVVKRKLYQWYNCLVGLEGLVYGIDESAFTDREKKNGAEKKLKVRATNRGRLVQMPSGIDKNVYQWDVGNICTLYEDEVIKIEGEIIQEKNDTQPLFSP